MFIAIEGIDGAGKTTQVQMLAQWLQDSGYQVQVCRDPGSTDLGESIRRILLESRHQIGAKAQMLLYMAARAQMVDERIAPWLHRSGTVVVADRYVLSNVVYQGYGCGLEPETIWQVGQVATGGVMPQLTLVLDVSLAVARQRLKGPRDRVESLGTDFFQRLIEGYRREASLAPERIVLIPAEGSAREVHEQIRQQVAKRLPPKPAEETS